MRLERNNVTDFIYIGHLELFLAHSLHPTMLIVGLSQTPFSVGTIAFNCPSWVHSLLTSAVYSPPASVFPYKVNIYSASRVAAEILCPRGMKEAGLI